MGREHRSYPMPGSGGYLSKSYPLRSLTHCAFPLRMWLDAIPTPSYPSLLVLGREKPSIHRSSRQWVEDIMGEA
jgi:hypothetical protein